MIEMNTLLAVLMNSVGLESIELTQRDYEQLPKGTNISIESTGEVVRIILIGQEEGNRIRLTNRADEFGLPN